MCMCTCRHTRPACICVYTCRHTRPKCMCSCRHTWSVCMCSCRHTRPACICVCTCRHTSPVCMHVHLQTFKAFVDMWVHLQTSRMGTCRHVRLIYMRCTFFYGVSLYHTSQRMLFFCFVLNKSKICGNSASNKSIEAMYVYIHYMSTGAHTYAHRPCMSTGAHAFIQALHVYRCSCMHTSHAYLQVCMHVYLGLICLQVHKHVYMSVSV